MNEVKNDITEEVVDFIEDEEVSEYLDSLNDDEAINKIDELVTSNDVVVESDAMSALTESDDNMVYYEITGVYRNEKEKAYRNRLKMRMNPPKLTIKNADGDEVNFALTEHFTDELHKSLTEVQRAYMGYATPRNHERIPMKELPNHMLELVKQNPLKAIGTVIVLGFVLYAFIVK